MRRKGKLEKKDKNDSEGGVWSPRAWERAAAREKEKAERHSSNIKTDPAFCKNGGN